MTWNHRVIRHTHPSGEVLVGIYEVYYHLENDEMACTEQPVRLEEGNTTDLRITLKRMLKALDKPVLDYDEDFPSEPEPPL